MLQGWKGLLLVLPLDTTHGSLSVHCAELPCNCFGLFCVNEKHIQWGLHGTASQHGAVSVCKNTNCRGGEGACTCYRLGHIFPRLCSAHCHIVHMVHHVASHHTHAQTHTNVPHYTNQWVFHSRAISLVWAWCKEERRMILSHMRYNSPVDHSTEQGDSNRGEAGREAGGDCLSVTSLSGKKGTKHSWISLCCS